ncbi:MAG: hypothetical protein J3R72DRAFT_420401 [Linnemannia gamsii]|nr:MAG: hypothetical protein J3R72DRAFT_420401 [Linnemannia gamsii]
MPLLLAFRALFYLQFYKTTLPQYAKRPRTVHVCKQLCLSTNRWHRSLPIRPATMATTIRVDSKKLTLDSGTPRLGDNKHGKEQSYQVIRDPHLFFDAFKTYCENSYGEAPFLASAQRLLCMAILDDQTRQQFTDELTPHSSPSLTWEEYEVAPLSTVF